MEDNDYEITPARTVREGFRWAWAVVILSILAVAVFLPMSLFLWHIGGVFQQKTIQRNYGNTVQSQQYQQSLVSEMQQHVSNTGDLAVTRASLPAHSGEQQVIRAQQLSEIRALCSESANFMPLSGAAGAQQMAAVVSANCLAGTPVANPPLANPVP